MKQIYCEICGGFQPLIEEPLVKEELNEFPVGDLVCGKCLCPVAALREVPDA